MYFKNPSERQINGDLTTSRLLQVDKKFENTFCLGAHRIESTSISHVVGVHIPTIHASYKMYTVFSKTGCRIFIYDSYKQTFFNTLFLKHINVFITKRKHFHYINIYICTAVYVSTAHYT
jgi:hypothetical protein